MAERFCFERRSRRLKGRARRITIDLDPTDDPTHGAQQLSFLNSHYDSWCYLPNLVFLTFNDEPEPYRLTAVLRSGKAVAWMGARGILRRLLKKLRRAFPGVRIRIRLDGGFAEPELLDFLDAQPDVEYVVAMGKNAVLKRLARPPLGLARRLSRQSGKTEHVYGECLYATQKTWSHPRRRGLHKAPAPPLMGARATSPRSADSRPFANCSALAIPRRLTRRRHPQ
jgi:hypothetical protein